MSHSPRFFVMTRVSALLAAWLSIAVSWQIGRGAESSTSAEPGIDWKREQQFWSFRPPLKPSRPAVKSSRWPRQEFDYFILSRLEEKNLAPAREASKQTIVRRVTLDVTGLPPTPQEADAFTRDRRGDAYEKLVDRLLASPRFGERMASLWLPLARYAEDQAHQVGADTKLFYPNAFKYREWVINAFNRDLPYNDFIQLQLAADKIPEASTNDLPALGFLGLGPKYYNRNRLDVMADEWEDRVDTVTRTFLGLTVACARCHDHKFDPITREDYYGLAGVFASTKMINKSPDGVTEKTDKQENVSTSTLHMVEDDKPQDLNVFIRGNVDRKGPVAPRQFIRILSRTEPAPFSEGSGRRDLAVAIADPNNPLTARVMVNRVWGLFFGKPIVESPSNFGHSGQTPSNAQLLDFLATRFVEQKWSIKTLVREILLSSTYRQDSLPDLKTAAADPTNESFGHMNRRRLSIEQWRDSLLFVAGELDFAGGKSLELDVTNNFRRTVYARISRLQLNSLLMQFDYPDANVHAEKRSTTTTAMQKLFALNSAFMIDRAKALATRLTADPRENETDRIRRAYKLLFAREPDKTELTLAREFLRKPALGEMSRWEQYAQTLLASNEMLYVD
jgi:hypothetical protein